MFIDLARRGLLIAYIITTTRATIRGSFLARTRNAYRNNLAVIFYAVQFVNSFLSFCIIVHLYKSESSGSTGFSIENYFS